MLPAEAKTYFESILSTTSATSWNELSQRQKEFERSAAARGVSPNSARLADLYRQSLTERAQKIVEALKEVHRAFNSPLDQAVDVQLRDWGAQALSSAYQGLEGAYVRHLQGLGTQPSRASSLDQVYALAQATVADLSARYLWELRNVPTKRPQPAVAAPPPQVIINNSGTIGALQTGNASTANVQQQWVEGDTAELRAALVALREALERAQDVEPKARQELIVDIDSVTEELEKERPSKAKILRWLGGIGAVIGTVADIKPAFEAVKDFARALGLPF